MNGADALGFCDAVANLKVYAFEPNPENFRRMQANRHLARRNIILQPLAVSDQDGEASFFIVDTHAHDAPDTRGMSSLYRRPPPWAPK